jgi:hypothetical protein
MQALTDVESIRGGRNELCSEPGKKRQYLFSDSVNERDFC